MASQASRKMSGVRAKAATASAQDLPQIAFATKPASAIQAMYPQRADSTASAFNAALEVTAASFRFSLASQGIATAAAAKIVIPRRLRCASRYPNRFRAEVNTTNAARITSNTPARRAARVSFSVNRKRQKTTAAESSSIKLSPPKANSAGLCDLQAALREI